MAQFSLRPVREVAQRRLDTATRELRRLAERRREAQGKLDQLEGFRRDYQNQLQQALVQGLEADRLRDYQQFLLKLARAIEAQGAELARCTQAWEEQLRAWLELRSREQALGVLEQRHLLSEAVREGRREQKQQDEFALNSRRDRKREPG
jgi:flagellar FliJ protein